MVLGETVAMNAPGGIDGTRGDCGCECPRCIELKPGTRETVAVNVRGKRLFGPGDPQSQPP